MYPYADRKEGWEGNMEKEEERVTRQLFSSVFRTLQTTRPSSLMRLGFPPVYSAYKQEEDLCYRLYK